MELIKRLFVVWFLLKIVVISYFLINLDIPSVPPEISPTVWYEFMG